MDDISGKKFSLQDWVTRRAANQAGGIASRVPAEETLQPFSIRRAVNGDVELSEPDMGAEPLILGSPLPPSAPEKDETKSSTEKGEKREPRAAPTISSPLGASSSGGSPVQQLQIVRLLGDLGERLRQSEKEREILWKEVESCRKQISDLDSRNNKFEQTCETLRKDLTEKEGHISEVADKQKEIEENLKTRIEELGSTEALQKSVQEKLEEKISSIETVAGSAIVRIEDVLIENNKLAKRVEQLGQDKARLVRKLEAMEETLTQTQETLKAKALVLLTDQALAARTALPQTPAWTGDDTLRVSRPAAQPSAAESVSASVAARASRDGGLVSRIGESLKKRKETAGENPATDLNNKAFMAALAVLVLASILVLAQMNTNLFDFASSAKTEKEIVSVSAQPAPEAEGKEADAKIVPAASPDKQEQLMSDIAKLANQIEPSTPAAEEGAAVAGKKAIDRTIAGAPSEFDKALKEEDAAIEKFKSSEPKGDIRKRIKADKALPQQVKAIESHAFEGDARAQHDLAAIYTAGQAGVKVNYALAAKWFTEAAHQNIANAQYNLGVLTQQGLGVKQDVGKAIDLYRVAASNGHPEAEYNLGIAYIEGVGAEYNPQIAAAYFQKAAGGGVVEGAYNLGLLHENGLLGESQPDEAVFWYSLAADKGNKQAVSALAQLEKKLSMSDADVRRIVNRIAQTKPGFLDMNGKPSLPDPVSLEAEGLSSQISGAAGESMALPVGGVDAQTITQIQEYLRQEGLFAGKSDGKTGKDLSQAISAYQAAHGLKVDGLPSEDLLVEMLANDTPAAGITGE